jgi:luciferase family oxidoreductase group 1
MLPNHAPLVVAEQFGTLTSLYPGQYRPGPWPRTGQRPANRYRHPWRKHERGVQLPARRGTTATIIFLKITRQQSTRRARAKDWIYPIWILGSSTDSARLAAAKGFPYAFASHFAPTYFLEAIALYRQNFRPSEYLDKPYVLSCINVVAADTDAEANRLATSVQQFIKGVVTGKRDLLPPPIDTMEGVWNYFEQEAVEQMLTYAIFGGPETVKSKMQAFIAETQVDEVMVTSHIFDHQARLRSYEIFADAMKQ